jgi:hypothetical protein
LANTPPHNAANFRDILHSGTTLIGTFLKTPSPIVTEVLSLTDLDCLCIDAEHAPFDRIAIDGSIAMARAAAMPMLVRVPATAPEHILNALDCGATGVVAPHIRSAAEARPSPAPASMARAGAAMPDRHAPPFTQGAASPTIWQAARHRPSPSPRSRIPKPWRTSTPSPPCRASTRFSWAASI